MSPPLTAEQSTAIVLRTIEFSETSLIVTLLTREFGRVSAIAKGARRPKGPFEGALDLLAVCRVVVLRKSSDSLDLLTEAKLHRRFRGGERSLERVYGGYHIAEMLRLLTDDHDPHPNVYDLTIRTLQQIDGIGEVACTGMHGANRLASNSLLEAIVFANRAAEHFIANPIENLENVPEWRAEGMIKLIEHAPLVRDLETLRKTMTDDVGIVRSFSRLERAKRMLQLLSKEVDLI